MLLSVFALVAAISPLAIDVTTRDGHHIVPVTDADATVLRVCASRVGIDGEEVCADVVTDRHGSHAALDVVDSDDLRLRVATTRYDARSTAPAAIAIGFGVGTALAGVGAVVATGIAFSSPSTFGGTANAAPFGSQLQNLAFNAALGLWVATGAGVVGTVIASVVAVGDAEVVHE